MQEIWKPVNNPYFQNIYVVSNLGNVKRIKKFNRWSSEGKDCDILLNQHKDYKGYSCVWLHHGDIRKWHFVHRLVAQAFISNPNSFPQVNHIDGNKENNNVSNLEWCTAKENIQHAMKNGLFMTSFKTRPVYQFSLNGEFIKKWDSGMDAARFLGIRECLIYECCNNNYSFSHGFVWSYTPEFNPKKLKIQRHHKNGVIQYDSEMNEIARFNSIKEAAEQTGANRSMISLCSSHKASHANGYIWEYV